MEIFVPFPRLVMAMAVALVLALPASAQVGSPCTANTIASFSSCNNFLTNSSANGTLPTAACCNSLKSITSTSRDCWCLLTNGSVPFQLPINRTLAISLPRACNLPGVPLQCPGAAAGGPIPARGPRSLSPTLSPGASPSAPTASSVPAPTSSAESPESDNTPDLTPSSTTGGSGAPDATTGSRPVVTPSAATPSYSPSLLLLASGILALKFF
ncbi:unnamed protein product [Malus baccata var. baccata]|uniref:Bifunctional inhibitor/plant lipid transfer protein/seed storage helical domain-containing protein n=1 Tax=Malus baccata TaxID=106549 RepID=A0A540N9C2_MALBA|nr:hypothetical protein C1H46_007284 [Malus baccata]